jgi:hypothetical protein
LLLFCSTYEYFLLGGLLEATYNSETVNFLCPLDEGLTCKTFDVFFRLFNSLDEVTVSTLEEYFSKYLSDSIYLAIYLFRSST